MYGAHFKEKCLKTVIWTREGDEILIDLVRNNEVIYNGKSKDYRKAHLKQNMPSSLDDRFIKSSASSRITAARERHLFSRKHSI